MHPLSNVPDRVVKKVSRACNTCRLKRKKCDGLDPCAFCIDNKLECLYSKEPRRRGPPSGYLRYMETRVTMLEILLGLYLSEHNKNKDNSQRPLDPFLDIAKTLKVEAKTCTQDVWDAHKALWTNTESEAMVEELVVSFAPFTPRLAQEVAVKTLLPLPPSTTSSSAAHDKQQASASTSNQTQNTKKTNAKTRASTAQTLKSETFERAGTRESVLESTSSPVSPKGPLVDPIEDRDDWQTTEDPMHNAFLDMQDSTANAIPLTHPIFRSQPPFDTSTIQMGNITNMSMALGMNDEYTGSYWRTVDLSLPEHDTFTPLPVMQNDSLVQATATNPIDLPPTHILSRLLDVFYQHSYPSYPLLPSRAIFDALLASPSKTDLFSTLVLSICAYSGRLSPLPHATSDLLMRAGGLAGKIVADLWYEQARTSLSTLLKKGSSLELVQVSLLLALRDYGKGHESQAWILVGLAVRMAQDLELDEEVNDNSVMERTPEETELRRNVWGVCVILDLLLSLQMGRPPANSEPLKITVEAPNNSRPPDVDVNPSPPFTYRVSLCRVISLIHYHLYLGYASPVNQLSPESLLRLRGELEIWHRSLPMQYRIAIGHQPRSDVLEINMLYHVAIILLYRPISSEQLNQQATDIFLEAASTFNVLLEKYRQSQVIAQSTSAIDSPAICHTNPNMIYLIYTVAIAHLSGYKSRQLFQGNSGNSSVAVSSTSALQTQLHLLKCLEALASIGFTWEMARRCWKALDTFMEMENLKPRGGEMSDENDNLSLGKRKRDFEENQKWSSTGTTSTPTKQQQPVTSAPEPFHPAVGLTGISISDPTTSTMITSSSSGNGNNTLDGTGFVHIPSMRPSAWDTTTATTSGSTPFSTSNSAGESSTFFDPSLFSTKWMPDASEAYNIDWDHTWEEASQWSETFMSGIR